MWQCSAPSFPGGFDRYGRTSYSGGMKTIVSEKGQVTIPKKLRDSLGIRPGDVLEFVEEEGGRLVGRKVIPEDLLDSVVGIIALPASVDEIIDEMRGGPYDL